MGDKDEAEEEGAIRTEKFDPAFKEFLGIEIFSLGGQHGIHRHQLQVANV